MSCRLCIKHYKQNALTGLNNNFKTTTLNRHADSVDHKESVEADQLRGHLQKSVDKVMSDQESAVVVALKTAYFLAQEGMPISKHGNILYFLSELSAGSDKNHAKRKFLSIWWSTDFSKNYTVGRLMDLIFSPNLFFLKSFAFL